MCWEDSVDGLLFHDGGTAASDFRPDMSEDRGGEVESAGRVKTTLPLDSLPSLTRII